MDAPAVERRSAESVFLLGRARRCRETAPIEMVGEAHLDLTCPDSATWQCEVPAQVTVRNAGQDDLRIHSIAWRSERPASSFAARSAGDLPLPEPPVLRAGDRVALPVVVETDSTFTLEVAVRSQDCVAVFTRRFAFEVTNRAGKEAALRACSRCGGAWGRWGFLQTEACMCRMPDQRKACTDGADCAGDCVWDGEAAAVTSRGRGGEPDLGFALGRCSEFQLAPGCEFRIDRGARAAGPQPLPIRSFSFGCID